MCYIRKDEYIRRDRNRSKAKKWARSLLAEGKNEPFLYPETAIFRAAVRSALMTCVNIIDENQLFLADSLDNLLKIGTMLYEQVHKMERDVENV